METTEHSEPFEIGRALRHGWSATQRYFPVLWVGGCIRACTNGGGGGGGGGEESVERSESLLDLHFAPAQASELLRPLVAVSAPGAVELAVIVGVLVVVVIAVLIGLAFSAWFTPGWIQVQAGIIQRDEGLFGTLFGTFGPFRRMFVWGALKSAILLLTGAAFVVPAVGAGLAFQADNRTAGVLAVIVTCAAGVALLYVFLGVYFGDHAVVLDGASPLEALAAGWDIVAGRRLSFAIFGSVVGLAVAAFAFAGVLACVIGLVATIPLSWAILDLSMTEAYLRMTHSRAEAESWPINQG